MKPSLVLLIGPAFLGICLASCATAPKVDPAAQALLEQTTAKLRSANTLQASGVREADAALLPPGFKHEAARFNLAVVRPNSVAVHTSDASGAHRLLAGSGGITMYDERANAYTTLKTDARNIDETVDEIEDQFDIKMTIGEMLGDDPMSSLLEDVTEVKVGGDEKVGGILCTRLDFTQKDLQWQLWIAKSDSLPRRSSLTYVKLPGQPKRVVTINQWKLDARVPDSVFSLNMKKGAHATEVVR